MTTSMVTAATTMTLTTTLAAAAAWEAKTMAVTAMAGGTENSQLKAQAEETIVAVVTAMTVETTITTETEMVTVTTMTPTSMLMLHYLTGRGRYLIDF